MSENKHMLETLRVGDKSVCADELALSRDCHPIYDNDGLLVGIMFDKADARRIAACVNACAGIRTEALEHRCHLLQAGDDQIVELSKQRDELQEEVNALKERAEYDLAEFARTLDTSYAEIKLLKNQRDELLAALHKCATAVSSAHVGLIVDEAIASVKGGAA